MSIIEAIAPSAMAAGCFSLPQIDAAVPVMLTRDEHRVRTLARFAQASEANGIPLPGGNFADVDQVIGAQWSQYLNSLLGPHDRVLAGRPVLEVQDNTLSVMVGAESDLNCFRLKPIIETLEEMLPGLGWFIYGVISKATRYGHSIYDMEMVQYLMNHYAMEMDEFTDEAYARAVMMDQGMAAPKVISPELIQELKEEYNFWPSDVVASVDGWVHLVAPGTKSKDPHREPRKLSARAVKAWAKANSKKVGASLAECALRLQALLEKDDRSFAWHAAGREDDTDCMGALCFLTWDEPSMLFEAASHYEQDQYQAGQAVEAFARNVLRLTDEPNDDEIVGLVNSTKQYFKRWALLAELLSFFPTTEDDDET